MAHILEVPIGDEVLRLIILVNLEISTGDIMSPVVKVLRDH